MPLNPSSMVSGFTSLFQGPALGAPGGAAKMAQIYFTYASVGLFGPNAPVFTGSEQGALASVLASAFVSAAPNPSGFGTAWQTGVTAFWMSPPIVVAGPSQAGAVTAIPGAASIAAALAALVSAPSNPAASAASTLASALHAATQTVIATVAPPPGTTIPIA